MWTLDNQPVGDYLSIYLSIYRVPAETALVDNETVGDYLQGALHGEYRREEIVEIVQNLNRIKQHYMSVLVF